MHHAGSVDEEKDEQGIAHLVEHVTFLGSSKREGLLGTGARSNAYTDFHHTVFHVHAPLVNTSFGEPSPMLPQVGLQLEFRIMGPGLHVPHLLCHCLVEHHGIVPERSLSSDRVEAVDMQS